MQAASSIQMSSGVNPIFILAILFRYLGSFALKSPSQSIFPLIKKASKYEREIKSSLRDYPKKTKKFINLLFF
jgi:hypothetical protein